MKKILFIFAAMCLCLALTTEAQAQRAVSKQVVGQTMKANAYAGAYFVYFVTPSTDMSRVNNTFESASGLTNYYMEDADDSGRRHKVILNLGPAATEQDVMAILDEAGLSNFQIRKMN